MDVVCSAPFITGHEQTQLLKSGIFTEVFLASCECNFHNFLNSFTAEKQTTKFSLQILKKCLSPSYIMFRIQRLEGEQFRSR